MGNHGSHLRNIPPKEGISWSISQFPLFTSWHCQPDWQVNQGGSGSLAQRQSFRCDQLKAIWLACTGMLNAQGLQAGTKSVSCNKCPGVLDTAKAHKRPDVGNLTRILCDYSIVFINHLFSMILLTTLHPLTTTINKERVRIYTRLLWTKVLD